ncbi:MAG TPA: aminotransferase class V-fold PLP-dependent enzyme [Pyrinomonadaceae bacterium]|jgi:selenocysteine lyase/cysteine desulfurase|nr:aminotransferase class V-fold PLP-dependent enzyme [Pyrinomonadaceae bacterium]
MSRQDVFEASEVIDWAGVRAEFPVTKEWAYLNSAGAGPVSERVAGAAAEFYRETEESGDRQWESWLVRREEARAAVARLINAEPDEVAFTTNTSSGMNLIVDALEGSREVVSCSLEFPVTTLPWMHRGVRVRMVEARGGVVGAEDILNEAKEPSSVICVSHVQYSNGYRMPIEEIGAGKGARLFVVNASQSAGVFPIDVKRMKVDALCATGHKWMLAGYGSGFVYLSRGLLAGTSARAMSWMSVEDPFRMRNDSYTLRADAAARAETGCPHFAGIFALGEAARRQLEIGPAAIEARALSVNRLLTESLRAEGRRVLSPLGEERWRSAETLVESDDPLGVVRHLSRRGVAVTVKPEGFRVATHFFNDETDIDRLLEALRAPRA